MKNILKIKIAQLFVLANLLIHTIASAQAPQGFNYQATVRNNAGALILNQNVSFKFNVRQNSMTGVIVYSENQTATTDDLGQVNLVVGQGTPTKGTFAGINWANGTYYLGIDLNTGSGYVAMGTTQLLSVPYALYANSAGSSQSKGKTSIYLTGNITNSQAVAKIAAELGPYTENIYIENTTQLTTVDLSAMVTIGNIEIENNSNLTNVIFNNLTTIEQLLDVGGNLALSSFSFPSLLNVNGIRISGNPSFSSLSFPLLTTIYSGLDLRFNAITTNNINSLLSKMLTVAPVSSKYISLDNQTPSAPPTGQGIIDKQTLLNAGNTLITD